MELNGARSNPRLQLELSRLRSIHERLLATGAARPLKPRPSPPRPSPVLETITLVLAQAGRPMPAREIHAEAERFASKSLLRTSVKAALAVGASGERPRFRRVRHGLYQSAR